MSNVNIKEKSDKLNNIFKSECDCSDDNDDYDIYDN